MGFICEERRGLECVEVLRLLRTVHQPVGHTELVVDVVHHAKTHVVEGQEVEPVRPRVVNLVFRVVAFIPQRAREFSEVDAQPVPDREHIRAVGRDAAVTMLGPAGSARRPAPFQLLDRNQIQPNPSRRPASGSGPVR